MTDWLKKYGIIVWQVEDTPTVKNNRVKNALSLNSNGDMRDAAIMQHLTNIPARPKDRLVALEFIKANTHW